MLFRDGDRLRYVGWRTRRAVYWVSNTLSKTLTNPQMLAIARSLSRFGGACAKPGGTSSGSGSTPPVSSW